MKLMIRRITDTLFCSLLAGLAGLACSAAASNPSGAGRSGAGAASGSGGASGLTSANSGAGGALSLVGSGSTTGSGLGCKTTVSGTVYDPAGTLPLYDVVVYVPSAPLTPIAAGASCETCSSYFSGTPIAAALSDSAGKFTMDVTAIPSATNVPLVIQVGKWQRQVTVPSITACADTAIDASLTRLPANKSEGNMPQMAMVRGGSDAVECLIRKLGVDDSEFTTDSGDGRVHLYYIDGGTATAGTGEIVSGSTTAPLTPSTTLYADLAKMMTYDLIMMACPGSDQVISGSPLVDFTNVRTYADQGGRVFGSHYNIDYINSQFTPANVYPTIVTFTPDPFDFPTSFTATGIINTTFPKGQAMSDWMVNVAGSTVPGQVPIVGGLRSVDAVTNPNAASWITATDSKGNPGAVEYFAFPTPIAGTACGRMVLSDLHVSSGTGDSGKDAFTDGCTSTDLSPQEKALAFMFFDIASCVEAETSTPMPPPTQ
jgi:hypothetical protein